MSIHDSLSKIGLNPKEIKVYTTLLKVGRVTPASISRLTKINRATVYNIGKSLINKGMIAEDLGGKTLYFAPLPIDSINQLIKKSRRELDEKEVLIKRAIEELSVEAAAKIYPVPKIRFVQEGDMEDFLYDNFTKWSKDVLSQEDGTWWGFQDPKIIDHYQKWVQWAINTKEYRDPKTKTRFLSNVAPIEGKMEKMLTKEKRNIRFVGGMNFTSSLWIAGEYLIMICTQAHPYYLVEIHDAALTQNMREVYKKLWELTERNGGAK